jgi:hypothetical protein
LPANAARRAASFIGNGLVLGAGALVAAGLLIVAVTLAAAWMVNTGIAGNTQFRTKSFANSFAGPGTLALALADPKLTAAGQSFETSFDTAWARASAGGVPLMPQTAAIADEPVREAARPQLAAPAVKRMPAKTDLALLSPKRAVERPQGVPLPRPYPELFGPPADKFTPQVAAIARPPASVVEKRAAPQVAQNRAALPPGIDDRTAVYDISARTVFLPSGERLEAHSGLYEKMDDPRYVSVRMRGATPPNLYDLTLREQLFHGVRAIRLNPVDEGKMFGRDGILAHTYMLGPNGQSNGCVSFKDYDRFLRAFLRGEVDRMVVVPSGGTQLALAARVRRGQGRYAANVPPERNAGLW